MSRNLTRSSRPPGPGSTSAPAADTDPAPASHLKRSVPLRSQLVIIFGGLVILGITISVVSSYLITSRALNQEVDNYLRDRAGAIIDNRAIFGSDGAFQLALIADQASAFAGSFAGDTTSGSILTRYETWVQITGPRNFTVRLQGGPIPAVASDEQVLLGHQTGTFSTRQVESSEGIALRLRVHTFRLGDTMLGQVGRDLSETDSSLSVLFYITITIGVLLAAFTSVLGWIFGKRIMRPVEDLVDSTNRITETQVLTAPIEVKGGFEIAQLTESFNRMLSALDSSRQKQRQFIADAGHELRTPLTSLRVNIELLAAGMVADPDEHARLLADMTREIDEFSQIVEELMELNSDFQRADELEWLNLNEVAQLMAARARAQTHRQVEVLAPDGEVEVWGHRRAIERAVRNLVENAAKFSPAEAPVEVTINVDAHAHSHAAELLVRDYGAGIPADSMDKIFDRFYRSVDVQNKPGSGLGLAITREVIKQHGGSVWARNHPGGGAEVGFRLPTARAAGPVGVAQVQAQLQRQAQVQVQPQSGAVLMAGASAGAADSAANGAMIGAEDDAVNGAVNEMDKIGKRDDDSVGASDQV